MSTRPTTACAGLRGSCTVDHKRYPSSAHSAFEFSTALDERGSVRVGAELVELDPEEEYPREFQVWANFNGTLLELKTAADIQHVQERVHTFLQQLAPLSSRLTDHQKSGSEVHQSVWGGVGFLGPDYGLSVPGGREGAIKAQLFQSEDDAQLPVAAFWSEECLTADITADQSRAFAMELRRMANDVDLLAARLDEITALRGADGVVEVPSEAA